MRLTDEQIIKLWIESLGSGAEDSIIATVRKCLALAALPDEQKDYQDVERRGFLVSRPGDFPT